MAEVGEVYLMTGTMPVQNVSPNPHTDPVDGELYVVSNITGSQTWLVPFEDQDDNNFLWKVNPGQLANNFTFQFMDV